jgi:hypothetical protein
VFNAMPSLGVSAALITIGNLWIICKDMTAPKRGAVICEKLQSNTDTVV